MALLRQCCRKAWLTLINHLKSITYWWVKRFIGLSDCLAGYPVSICYPDLGSWLICPKVRLFQYQRPQLIENNADSAVLFGLNNCC